MSDATTSPSQKKYYDNISIGKRTKQRVYFVAQHDKTILFELFLNDSEKKQTIIITKSKIAADELHIYLNSKSIKSLIVHGNHRKEQIEEAKEAFNSGAINILLTTDMILFSLDLQNIELIVNYDLPLDPQNYFKRLRYVDEVGEAITFVKPDDEKILSTIEFMMQSEMIEEEIEDFKPTPAPTEIKRQKKPRHKTLQKKAEKKAAMKAKWGPKE